MRRNCKILFMLTLILFMTGCVKFNANMDIRKDKSMDFKIIYAVDTSIFGETEMLETEEKEKLISSGFVVNDYEEGKMKGVTISREIKNIDFVSSTEDTKYSISGVFEADAGAYLFKVKKGLLKNVYTADLTFDSDDSSLNGDTEDETIECDPEFEDCTEENDEVIEEDIESEDEITTEDEMEIPGLESAVGSMDLSFNVTLPYAAISNNASEVTNEGKNLRWELTTNDVASMQFQFELYNMTTIYIMIAGGVLLLLIIVLLVVIKMKGSKKKETISSQDVNVQPVQFNGMDMNNNGVVNNNMNMVSGAVFPQPEMNSMASNIPEVNNVEQVVNEQPVVQNNMSESMNVIPQMNNNSMVNNVMPQDNNVVVNNMEQNNGMIFQTINEQPMMQNNMSEPMNVIPQMNNNSMVNNVMPQDNTIVVNNMEQNNVMSPQSINPQPIISNTMPEVNNVLPQESNTVSNNNVTNVPQNNNDVNAQSNVVNYGGVLFVQGVSNNEVPNNQNMN